MKLSVFESVVNDYYKANRRHMPWRENTDPYWVLVSEIMLQQTQVSRVEPKFIEFITCFPTIKVLANAPLAEVLQSWSGLGYNRRAKYLHESAKYISQNYDGKVPNNLEDLISLPGIGPNTAGAILAYAYNLPVVFIETNIRSVYIHHFFDDKRSIDDKEILPLIEKTLGSNNPREWYWALMDYGTHLKASLPNPSRSSKHHQKQSKFEGSDRQIRGKILRELNSGVQSIDSLAKIIDDPRFAKILQSLANEGFLQIKNQTASLTGHTVL